MAKNNQENTSTIDTVSTTKPALITDLNPTYLGKESYSYARNMVRNSKEGDLGTIGNEPSNTLCIPAPYKILGTVDLPDNQIVVFSGDDVHSEIGIGDLKKCTYKKLATLDCLAFSSKNPPITGVAKKDFGKGIVVTFTDKNSGVRRANLSKLSKVSNCDDLLLFKKLTQPCLSARKGQSGNIPNGVYSVALAYIIDGQIYSDWYSITNRVQLFSETSSNSINVTISGLDKEFDQFSLVVVGNYIDPVTKGATKTARIVGTYSTKLKSISISDFTNHPETLLSNLVIKKKSWQKAGIISSNSNYLMLADLVGRDEENYQLKAMSIEAEYVVEQVAADYYENDGEDVGNYRDENYQYFIEGAYNTGEFTDKFHLRGRQPKSKDREIVSSADVYEYDTQFSDCTPTRKMERWEIENTAGDMIPYNNKFSCGRRVLGRGEFGYFESTDLYPDNKDMFGEDAGKPQVFHKYPDECKVSRYSVIDGKTYINILGIRFKNIPAFDSPDIVGYRITRSDRKGGNGTVVARGIMTNVRSYNDDKLNQTIYYSNYNVNDLSPDQYLSSTQAQWKNAKEQDFSPLTDYHKDKFSFYSPHTLFEPKYSLGSEIKIESEEIATIEGKFEKVFNHPRQKLMNQFSFWLAAAVGFIESSLVLLGKETHTAETEFDIKTTGADAGVITIHRAGQEYNIKSVEDLVGLDIVGFIRSKILAKDLSAFTIVKNILVLLASLSIKIPFSIFAGIKEADDIFATISNFTGYTDYVYQYNSHALFNNSLCIASGNKRRRLLRDALYIPSDVVTIDDRIYNNYLREQTIYLELNKEIDNPKTKDTSRNTASGYGVCSDINKQVESTGSAFYVTSKVANPNQYGELGSASPVSMHSCVLTDFNESPILYGGDCIIARMQIMKKMPFFNQNIANTNYPDGVEYDYRLYRNIAYPRYWIDSTKYDFSNLLSSNVVNFTKFSRTTTNKYNLDCKHTKDGGAISRIDDAYMYLSNNCVLDFFVECDYNISFREKTEHSFYSKNSTNLSQIFRSDKLAFPEEFKINRVYSDIYTTEIYNQQQREDFDPNSPIPAVEENAVIYSLPSFNLQNIDNWQYFLPANFFSFRESDFGRLTGIHKLDQDRLIFLFSKSSPYISMGRDFLQLEGSGRKITIGDGGLFAQDPREIIPTDNNYGACNSRWAFSNTHMGRFYPSENQGRILSFTEGIDDISRQGMSYWCKNYVPIFLYKYFPDYTEEENPISGVGYLSVFDSFNETYYLTKRDFSPKYTDITWDILSKSFMYQGRKIGIRDPKYFNDVSWTISYSPADKGFISWHDWYPDWTIQTDNHFMTIKDNGIWKHNESFDSFCSFYGKDCPFEWGPVSSAGQQVETIRSIEYLLEVYKYKNFGRNKFHVLNENFDSMWVSNSEQISPLLNLIHGSADPEQNLLYPKKNTTDAVSYDVLFFKEENKYRINMFWDSVRDRGEFSGKEVHLLATDESGYKSVINPLAIDIDKPEEQRKKFRHYFNNFRFIKRVSGANKFIVKLLNIKKLVSMR